ncbi:MAG: 5-(carboxyamino)imidazole ribonucleotide synthase [Rhizobiales bacterium]|nr:5-(carboxyamino)imidazole ribonucleotide synthase [Hyphomicrobiales bacterium]MBL6770460.1 5-(carboxyamino)imidazole ribonucleotide synthase [Hyphomicrobiales bacterium]
MTNKVKTIGIFGGGQLGQMLSQAAASLGFKTCIYSPDENSPAFMYSDYQIIAEYDDINKLDEFVEKIDFATIEFENIPIDTIQFISNKIRIFPPINAIEISQDRIKEKNFCRKSGIKTNRFQNIESEKDLKSWDFSTKSVLKTRMLGYDGKGQIVVNSYQEALDAFNIMGQYPCIIEEFVYFSKEISTITARDKFGSIFTFPPSENIHKNHILDETNVPANISKELEIELYQTSANILENLKYIGILSIEFFMEKDSQAILVNEIAPRVHNSGHWTLDGSNISQFEQHIRAISGMKIVEPELLFKTRMLNLIGEDVNEWNINDSNEKQKIYIYGKDKIKKGRKMGHVNFINDEQTEK